MRKLIVGMFVSLDGVIQAPGGADEDTSSGFKHGGWVFGFWDEGVGEALDEAFAQPFDLLLGRKTYDIFAGYWPNIRADHPNNDIAERFNTVRKYVATHREEGLDWANTVRLGDDLAAAIREVKSSDGPALLTQGSSDLVHQLLAADLVDELRLITFPVVLGKGQRLFDDTSHPGAYKIVQSRITDSGVVIAHYQRDGDVKTGEAPA